MITTMVRSRRHVGLKQSLAGFLAVLALSMFTLTASAEENFITLASTTSTANSGLFDHIFPQFTARTGIAVRVVAVGTGAARDAPEALRRIAAARAPFVSRGDDSGTHKAELRLWGAAGDVAESRTERWYMEAGSGMGATLNTAAAMAAYTLTDRGTWLSFRNRGDLVLLVEGDSRLFNPYGVIWSTRRDTPT